MGSTVSTGKLIGAFRRNDGQPCYVMFEQTYEKNCHPHTPSWSARAIGGVETMLQAIFANASACEGGMLQGPGGRITNPETYIAGWLKEMANPVSMRDLEVGLKVSESWSATLTQKHLTTLKPTLLALGYQVQVAALEAGDKVSASLHKDSQLLSALYDGKTMGAWRIIQSYDIPVNGIRDASLGFKPEKAKTYDVTAPRFMRVSQKNENILKQSADGSWRCEGWAYSIIGEFVTNLWKAEMREPGSFRNRIKSFRDAVEGAALLPSSGVKVIVDTAVPVEGYAQSSMESLLAKVTGTRVGSEVHFSVPESDDLLYSVTSLPVASTKWVLTLDAPRPTPGPAPMEQLSLLAC